MLHYNCEKVVLYTKYKEGNLDHLETYAELVILHHLHYDVLKVLIRRFPLYQRWTIKRVKIP